MIFGCLKKLYQQSLYSTSLHNPFIKVYYLFLEWVLPKFTKFNAFFQSDKVVIAVLHDKVCLLCKELLFSFMQREYVVKTDLEKFDPSRQDKYLKDTGMYLGVGVRSEFDKIDSKENKF